MIVAMITDDTFPNLFLLWHALVSCYVLQMRKLLVSLGVFVTIMAIPGAVFLLFLGFSSESVPGVIKVLFGAVPFGVFCLLAFVVSQNGFDYWSLRLKENLRDIRH